MCKGSKTGFRIFLSITKIRPGHFEVGGFTVVKSKNWPPLIFLKLKFSYINQGPWTWIKRNYINISHRKKVYLVTDPRISEILKITPGSLNKLFSYGRYWCNYFCFMVRGHDLDNKISISRNSKVVSFSVLLLWNQNFKVGVLHGFEAWPNSKGGILQVGQNYDLCELGGMFGTLFPKSNRPNVRMLRFCWILNGSSRSSFNASSGHPFWMKLNS